ncbi:flavodoxin [Pseudoflavonifractor sp. An85]|uniref:flavodoxin n=1 Tax=Pseudoflavonifractor sp. An85 TaxID=1965661 RepID=UPI000B365374|nr:flavodoxin [Pseudoflavonifractor sp. An85]OUN25551.1 flavodoxin [Pseudoflavonifractor sp. An85]
MSKVAVIYWSQTGNTQQMAQAIADGVTQAGAECDLMEVSAVTPQQALEYEKLALGCPAMGAEVLEESEFEPFFTQLEGQLGGRKVALFGSYGWGDGQWMRDWVERTQNAGANLVEEEGLMVNEAPDADDLEACKKLGAALATY